MRTVEKMIFSKKKLKSSLNEVKRQIHRRETYNRDVMLNHALGRASPPNYTDATLDQNSIPPTVQGWSEATQNYDTFHHRTNTADFGSQHQNEEVVAEIGVQDH